MKIIDECLNILFPKDISCVFCDNDVFDDDKKLICSDCKKSLPFITENHCKICGLPINKDNKVCDRCKSVKYSFSKAVSVFLYKDKVALAIQKFKFFNAKYMAEPFGKMLEELYNKEFNFKVDVIVPVPMFGANLKKRGYNQTELLSRCLGKNLGIDVNYKDLIKFKNTKSQVELNFKERQTNLKNAFKVVNKNAFKDKTVLIVDDIFTTGATVENCSKVLLKAGAKKVFVITLAHTMYNV